MSHRPSVVPEHLQWQLTFSFVHHPVLGIVVHRDYHTHLQLRNAHPEFFERDAIPFEPTIGSARILSPHAIRIVVIPPIRDVDINAIAKAICVRARMKWPIRVDLVMAENRIFRQ